LQYATTKTFTKSSRPDRTVVLVFSVSISTDFLANIGRPNLHHLCRSDMNQKHVPCKLTTFRRFISKLPSFNFLDIVF